MQQSTPSGGLSNGKDGFGGRGRGVGSSRDDEDDVDEGKCWLLCDSPRSSSVEFDLPLFSSGEMTQSRLMFWHQLLTATSVLSSLGVTSTGPLTSLLGTFARSSASAKISSALLRFFTGIIPGSGGLPMGRQSADPDPSSHSRPALFFLQSPKALFFSVGTWGLGT